MTQPPPAWLVPHARDEPVVRTHEPDRRWVPLGWTLLGFAAAVYFGGAWFLDLPGPWSWVGAFVPVATPTLPAGLALIIGSVGFASRLVTAHLKRHHTAYALTPTRLLVVPLTPVGRAGSWPLAQVHVVEHESERKRERTRIEVRAASGKRLARFRITLPPGSGLPAALRAQRVVGASSR